MITDQQRRNRLLRRHRLRQDAATVEQVAADLIALHATDPATVYLSVLARCASATLADVTACLHDRRTLVRWMAMRRTLFVAPVGDIPTIQAAAGQAVADTMRRRLVRQLERNGTDPPIEGPIDAWLDEAETGVRLALAARGSATATELSADEPRLRTAILPRARSEVRQNVTSRLLVLMAAEGTLVRGEAALLSGGPLPSRRYRWEPVDAWWPRGLPSPRPDNARAALARRWLAVFGPATVTDLEWWTGWTKSQARHALATVGPIEVELESGVGLALRDDPIEADPAADEMAIGAEPDIALLPSLDPTPMGWKQRDWFFGTDPGRLFDRFGNVGPTIWCAGEVIGGWAVRPDGEVVTRILTDRGAAVRGLVALAADRLERRLEGAAIIPTFPTPLETDLRRS